MNTTWSRNATARQKLTSCASLIGLVAFKDRAKKNYNKSWDKGKIQKSKQLQYYKQSTLSLPGIVRLLRSMIFIKSHKEVEQMPPQLIDPIIIIFIVDGVIIVHCFSPTSAVEFNQWIHGWQPAGAIQLKAQLSLQNFEQQLLRQTGSKETETLTSLLLVWMQVWKVGRLQFVSCEMHDASQSVLVRFACRSCGFTQVLFNSSRSIV